MLSFRPKGEITLVTTKIADYVCGISSAISPFGRNDKLPRNLTKFTFSQKTSNPYLEVEQRFNFKTLDFLIEDLFLSSLFGHKKST